MNSAAPNVKNPKIPSTTIINIAPKMVEYSMPSEPKRNVKMSERPTLFVFDTIIRFSVMMNTPLFVTTKIIWYFLPIYACQIKQKSKTIAVLLFLLIISS